MNTQCDTNHVATYKIRVRSCGTEPALDVFGSTVSTHIARHGALEKGEVAYVAHRDLVRPGRLTARRGTVLVSICGKADSPAQEASRWVRHILFTQLSPEPAAMV